jgi:tetratricopeptide (TPR) repeat protein
MLKNIFLIALFLLVTVISCCIYVMKNQSHNHVTMNKNGNWYKKRDQMVSLNTKAISSLDKGDLKESENLFRQMLALDSYSESASSGLAQCLEKQSRDSEALDVYRHVVQGGTYEIRNSDGAMPQISMGHVMGTTNIHTLYSYGKLAEKLGEKDEALQAYKKTVSSWIGYPLDKTQKEEGMRIASNFSETPLSKKDMMRPNSEGLFVKMKQAKTLEEFKKLAEIIVSKSQ